MSQFFRETQYSIVQPINVPKLKVFERRMAKQEQLERLKSQGHRGLKVTLKFSGHSNKF